MLNQKILIQFFLLFFNNLNISKNQPKKLSYNKNEKLKKNQSLKKKDLYIKNKYHFIIKKVT